MSEDLRPGVALFDGPDGAPALRDAAGVLLDVDLPADAVRRLRAWWSGAPGGTAPEELAAFAAAGHLGGPAGWPAHRSRVAVLAGDAAPELTAALRAAGADPAGAGAGPVDPAALLAQRPAAVVAVHHGPAPAWWAGLDALAATGTAWVRVAVEGRHALVEPLACAPGDVGHADVRARRLASAGSAHRHLQRYWASAAPTPLAPADRALLAALVVTDLRAWATGAPPAATGALVPAALPARRRLRVVDLDTGAVADHPVLPVPACAP